MRTPALTPSSAASGRQAAIERAKLEWESTVDALAGLVCLLSGDGKVVRTNRVVEDWSLGTVSGVLGKNAHSLLHPGCVSKRCGLAVFFETSMTHMRRGASRTCELNEVINMRHLQLTIRPVRRRSDIAGARGDPRAVLVVTDQSALHRAQDALELLNANLESSVRNRTNALAEANRDLRNEIIRREQAEVALRGSRNELKALSEQLIMAQESERKRIAVELHDSVGQSLSAVKYSLERGVEMLRNPELGDPAAVFEQTVKRIQETAESIRYIAAHLRPRVLDELGAASAVHWFCHEFATIYPGLEVKAEVTVEDGRVPDRLATVDATFLLLQVRDDGIGLDTASVESRLHGSGLRNLRERAEMTGGQFSVTRPTTGGTLAQLHWQLYGEEREDTASGA
jgi:signal transduction histidine kinase